MSGMVLWEYERSRKVHGDPGGGITLCGAICEGRYWSMLTTFGSLYDIDCRRCVAALKRAGDLSEDPR